MADDQSQRPYRASEPPVRSAAKPSGNDPLAELARLIGQTDPFAEFGRESARRASTQQPGERSDWNTPPLGSPFTSQGGAASRAPAAPQKPPGTGYFAARPEPIEQPADVPQNYGSQNYGRQPFGGAPLSHGDERYHADAHGYPADQAGYEQPGYEQGAQEYSEEEYYEDVPPSRRRLGIMAIAAVFALAVIGTAGAFGYRTLFGSSGSSLPPPVIKADAGPSKVVPATTGKDAQSNKLITDRMNERGQSEKLVSREEQPIDKPAMAALSQSAPQAALGSGVVAGEPKKIRTIAIRPDQSPAADAMPSSPLGAAAAPPARAVPASPPQAQAQVQAPAARPAPPLARAAAERATAEAEQDQASAQAAHPAPPVRQAAPAGGSSGPLSLNPNAAPARAPAAAAPTRTASLPPAAASSASAGAAGSYVQVSSQRSEAEAQAAFRGLQAKFPSQLGSRQAMVHKVDLGAKGTYYRAMVGPFATANEAAEMCSSLKAAGGQCLVQRN
jgi:sporulation related protein